MAGSDDADSPPIENRAQLIEALERGARPKSEWKVGTEHEKHVFHTDPLRPVRYGGEDGIQALLAGVAAATGWSPVLDNGNVIGLDGGPGAGAISLEPAGQFELSGAPREDLHQTAAETRAHLEVAKAAAAPLDIHFLGLGTTPLWSVAELPAMPKSRYAIMAPYMQTVGTLGTSMMFRSCTVQSNLDFSSEADMVRKLRLSVALQPLATALFANSPFIDGEPSGSLSFRSFIWLDTDNARTGMLPFAFEEGMGFERYVDYALSVPMYFVRREGRYINTAGESFRAFLDGRLPQLPGETPRVGDWENHLSTLFPEVRLKRYLEMRGADMGDAASITALSALWTGLLYDDIALDAAWELVRDWTTPERFALRGAVTRTGIHTPLPANLRFGTIADLAREVVGIASAGLARRDRTDEQGRDEAIYLRPIEDILQHNQTSAERWLERYRGAWGGDLTRIFAEAEL